MAKSYSGFFIHNMFNLNELIYNEKNEHNIIEVECKTLA